MIGVSKRPTVVTLTQEDRSTLEGWVRAGKTERRLAERAKIILLAADGQGTIPIARTLRMRAARVSKWRVRFRRDGLRGLQDAPRPGAVRRYDENTENRILATLDEPPRRGTPPGAGRCWPSRWAMCPNMRSGGCCGPEAFSCSGGAVGVSRRILSLPPRRPISWGSICTHRRMRWCCRSTKSRISKLWNEPRAI